MSNWSTTTIGEYCDLLNGYAFKSKDFIEMYLPDTLPILKIKNVANGDANLNDAVYHKTDSKLEKYKVEKGDILIALTGNHPIDKTQVVGGVSQYKLSKPALLNQRVGKIYSTNDKKLSNQFLYYYLTWSRTQFYIGNQSSGSASQANISKADVLGIPIYTPPIDEQNEIAQTLSNLDQKIALLRQQNETLEQIAQTLFKRWFVDLEFPDENGNPYKSSGGKMIASELGEIPEGWKVYHLSEFVQIHNGYSYKGDELQESNEALVTLKNFDRTGGFRYDGFKELVSDRYKEKHLVYPGDLIVAHTDLTQDAEVLGNPALILENPKYEKLIISMDLVKVESKEPLISTEFLYYLMKDRNFKSHCVGYSNGTTVLHLSKSAIPEYEIALPSDLALAQKLGIVTKSTISKIANNTKEMNTLINLRDTLLPKLMGGEIRVKME
ncbi:MAG: restriction endonuclease subunit S [Ekhidna sp.]